MLCKRGVSSLCVAAVLTCLMSQHASADDLQGVYEQLPRISSASPFLADCNGPKFPMTAPYVNAESEPYLAINPTNTNNMIAVYHEDRYPDDGSNGVLASTSFDGGRTWSVFKDQPTFTYCSGGTVSNGGDFELASDPFVTFGADGTAYFGALSWNASSKELAQFVSASHDGGRTWDKPVAVVRSTGPAVNNGSRPALATDPNNAQVVYMVWDQQRTEPSAEAHGGTAFSRSNDGGKTWSEPRIIYKGSFGLHTAGNNVNVLPNGDVLVVFNLSRMGRETENRHAYALRSSDGGVTWETPAKIATAAVFEVNDPRDVTRRRLRIGSFVHVAVDRRPGANVVYVAWSDSRFGKGQEILSQIALSKSTDGGRSWSKPVAVLYESGAQKFLPSIAVNDHGVVALGWYSFAKVQTTERSLPGHYWLAFSKDQGVNWTRPKPVTPHPFDVRTAPWNDGFMFGDYEGLASGGDSFTSAITLPNGRNLDNRTDIYACTTHPDGPAHPTTGTVCSSPVAE